MTSVQQRPPDILVDEKRCPTCGLTKPWHQFYRNKQNNHGLAIYCKVCDHNRAVKKGLKNGDLWPADKVIEPKPETPRSKPDKLPESKMCSACHEIKPWSAFHQDPNSADGLRSKCKECIRAYDTQRCKQSGEQTQAVVKHESQVPPPPGIGVMPPNFMLRMLGLASEQEPQGDGDRQVELQKMRIEAALRMYELNAEIITKLISQ